MLTLDANVRIPVSLASTLLEEDAVLLNTKTNRYYALDGAGARMWGLLKEKKPLREAYNTLLDEFEVEPIQLEQDMLDLLGQLMDNGLVEVVKA
jgi:hypothetical protein